MSQNLPLFRRLLGALFVGALATSIVIGQASTADAAGPGEIDFDGGGWGHGVGLSQWGAFGRAQAGQDYETILNAYYTDATIGALGQAGIPDPGLIYTGVATDVQATTLTVRDGPGTPRNGMQVTWENGDASPPMEMLHTGDSVTIVDTNWVHGEPRDCEISVTISGATTEWGTGICDVTVQLISSGSQPTQLVEVTNCTRPLDCTFGLGTRVQTVDNGSPQRTLADRYPTPSCSTCPEWRGFDIVVASSLDDYTRGVSEVPFSWPEDALKAQAVAARSYAATYALDTDHTKAGCFCDLKNSSSFQVYAGWLPSSQYSASWDRWDKAARDTASEVVAHPATPSTYQGIVRAYFSSSNGGASEWVKDKWGGDYPFLVSVSDPFSLVPQNPRSSWTFTKTGASIAAKVWGSTSTPNLVAAEVIARNASGSAKTVRFTGTTPGGALVTKDVSSATLQGWYGLYSWYFEVDDSKLIVSFVDIADSVFAGDIGYLASVGAAVACDAGPDRFCPDDRMRREDFAAFMVRAMNLPAASKDYFIDDNGLPFEDEINALAQAGITKGCNPPANDRFCPDNTVSRGQTAAFIVRAWSLTDPGPGNWFVDDDTSEFRSDIDRLAQTGITKGCNPPTNNKYCPTRLLTRGEMSAFLARALRNLGTP